MGDFAEKVLEIARKIPKGKVCTYSEIARAAGNPKACRAVGNALNKNLKIVEIPCHRVVRSDGRVGGYAQGTEKKIEILKYEGIEIENGKVRNLERFLHKF